MVKGCEPIHRFGLSTCDDWIAEGVSSLASNLQFLVCSMRVSITERQRIPTQSDLSLAWWATCLTLVALFWAAWLFDLGRYAYTSDEAAMALMADSPDAGLPKLNIDEPHGPVYLILLRAWRVTIGGENEYLLRYPSVVFGVLLLAVVVRLARRLGLGRWNSLIAMTLIGLNPQITVHVREVRPYGLMVLTLALAAAVGLSFERLRVRWLASLTSLLAMLAHYFTIPFIGVLGLWGLWAYRGRVRRDWVLTQAVAVLGIGIWLPLMGRAFLSPTSLTTGKTWSFLLPPWETIARVVAAGAQGYREFLTSPASWPAALLLGIGLIVGGLLLKGRGRWLVWALGAGTMVGYALLASVKPVYHPKYMLPWLVFAALGLTAWARYRPLSGRLASLALAALMVLPTWRTLARPYDPGVVDTPDATTTPFDLAHTLLSVAGSNDAFGLGTPDPVHCYYLQHYFESRSLGCRLFPQAPTHSLGDLRIQVASLLSTYDVLWYLDFHNSAWDPQNLATTALNQMAVPLGDEWMADQHVLLFAARTTIEDQAAPIGARFGESAELRGAWARVGNDRLHLVLVWRGLAEPTDVNAKVFVHLVDSTGTIIGQSDGVPVNWTRPLSSWTPGEVLLDVHVLDLAPDADLRGASLRVGLYDADTLDRVVAVDRDGNGYPQEAVTTPLILVLSPEDPADRDPSRDPL